LRFNEYIEAVGPTVFAQRLQDGFGGHRIEAEGLDLSLRPLAPLGARGPVFAQSTFPGPSVSPAVFQNCSGWDFSYVGNPTDKVPACV
jgi:hypothetical protein